MITVTFIRHGESEDNVRTVWAGWKDAPLTELGRKQAYSLGHSLSSTPITHIYSSDLQRAHTTAQFVHQHQPQPKPPLTVTARLREQHFGIAEGHRWVYDLPTGVPREAMYAQKVFPVLYERHERFPEGESLDEVAQRAERAVRECILPHVLAQRPVAEDDAAGVHIALASHGLCISETVAALLRLDPEADKDKSYRGLNNTAWARVEVRTREGHDGSEVHPENPPPLEVIVTHFNAAEHLESLKDIPPTHEGDDGASAESRAFFGGAKV